MCIFCNKEKETQRAEFSEETEELVSRSGLEKDTSHPRKTQQATSESAKQQ